jgi:hypothetical protein
MRIVTSAQTWKKHEKFTQSKLNIFFLHNPFSGFYKGICRPYEEINTGLKKSTQTWFADLRVFPCLLLPHFGLLRFKAKHTRISPWYFLMYVTIISDTEFFIILPRAKNVNLPASTKFPWFLPYLESYFMF